MKDRIEKIIAASIKAPSGENCQPWKILIKDREIELYNDPTKDMSLYNFEQKGSMAAHGAFVENLVIASKHEGLDPKLVLFPDSTNSELIAKINFAESQPQTEDLYEAI